MKDANDRHEPTDEFIAYLERDLRRAARHEARFPSSAGPIAPRPRPRGAAMALGIAASVVLSLSVGIVLGASANAAAAATTAETDSPFAMRPIKTALQTLGCALAPAAVPAVSDAGRRIAIVDLPTMSVRSTPSVAAVFGLQQMSDGRLLINDAARHQLRLFDADLATSTVVLDSIPVASRSYASAGLGTVRSSRGAKLFIPFRGDSSLFGPDGPPEHNMLVLDGRGRAVRSFAMPSIGQPPGFTDSVIYFDSRGRLIYRQSATMSTSPSVIEVPSPKDRVPFTGRGAVAPTMRVVLGRADSLPIVRVDFESRVVDTLGHVMLPPNGRPGENGVGNGGGKLVAVPDADGKAPRVLQVINPLVTVDDWAVLSDGTIGIVRGSDYHVDWIRPDGSRSASPKLPFEWSHLSAADKQRLVDSTRAAVDSLDALANASAAARGGRSATGGPAQRQWPYEIVSPAQLPDAYPPIRSGAAKPDADGNLWILPTTSDTRAGGLVYDVVNPAQGLVRRVRLPIGRSIAGFGKGGVVYLQVGDAATGVVIERTTLPRLAPR